MRTTLGRAVRARVSTPLLVCLAAAALTACGGGGANESTDTAASADATSTAQAINIRNQIALPVPVTPTGTMTVSWAAPTTSADGLKIGDLAGFRVYYGTSSGSYTSTMNVPGATTLSTTISGLPTSTYYVVVKAYDSSNNESSASSEVSLSVR